MPLPPMDFLLEASMRSLQDLELVSLNHAANLSKAMRSEFDTLIDHRVAAKMARWMIEHRDEMFREASLTVEIKPQKVEFFEPNVKRTA